METYPGELLVGVFPLVFCVDATIAKANQEAEEGASGRSNSTSPPHVRSQFDRFLDAMAANLMNEIEDHPLYSGEDPSTPSKPDGMMSLFRGDDGEEDDSEAEDDLILGSSSNTGTFTSPTASYDGSAFADADSRQKSGSSAGRSSFSHLGLRFNVNRTGSRSNINSSSNNASEQPQHALNTSYAKAVQDGQGFFQRARIVPVSSRHGFPPSKDPKGEQNRVDQFMDGNNKTLQTNKLLAATKQRPIDGILPSGWLEKHAHALPSVLLLVVQVTHDQQQFTQDQLLLRTLENLQYSLASKRQCTIQIVGLVQEGVSKILAEQWSQTIADRLNGQDLTFVSSHRFATRCRAALGLETFAQIRSRCSPAILFESNQKD
jgi:hypothetical protein